VKDTAFLFEVFNKYVDWASMGLDNNTTDQNGPPIDRQPPRAGAGRPRDPAKALRYNERTGAERGNSYLKDNYSLESLRVQWQLKVARQIMFAVIALTAKKIFILLPKTVQET